MVTKRAAAGAAFGVVARNSARLSISGGFVRRRTEGLVSPSSILPRTQSIAQRGGRKGPRRADMEAFRFRSARNPDGGINVAFLDAVFQPKKLLQAERWICTGTTLRAVCSGCL